MPQADSTDTTNPPITRQDVEAQINALIDLLDTLDAAPRGLRRVDAARYLGISPTHFDKQVMTGYRSQTARAIRCKHLGSRGFRRAV
jgi:hypothetical protein